MNRPISKTQSRAPGGMKLGAKRKAEVSPTKKAEPKKRSAFGDITNVNKTKMTLRSSLPKTNEDGQSVSDIKKSKMKISVDEPTKPQIEAKKSRVKSTSCIEAEAKLSNVETDKLVDSVNEAKLRSSSEPVAKTECKEVPADKEEESLLYSTAIETPDDAARNVAAQNLKNQQLTETLAVKLPEGVVDFDAECGDDPFQVGMYAYDIFEYYKRREVKFPVRKYLDKQKEINKNMRSILVDWMVEVQENFELNHETLYLAVKLVDLFLGKVQVSRDKLQLVGTTALYIAAKFDERSPPLIDDFCYICDDAYPTRDVLHMEVRLLRSLDYDIGMPLSYRFLRRYARCIKLEMEPLTFARFILESSLMNYDLIDVRDSMLASACLLLALTLKGFENAWTPTLVYYSGYTLADLFDLTHRVHHMITNIPTHLKTIKSKYSHKVFYEVAKIPLPEVLQL